jgi:hypothetical protein
VGKKNRLDVASILRAAKTDKGGDFKKVNEIQKVNTI